MGLEFPTRILQNIKKKNKKRIRRCTDASGSGVENTHAKNRGEVGFPATTGVRDKVVDAGKTG